MIREGDDRSKTELHWSLDATEIVAAFISLLGSKALLIDGGNPAIKRSLKVNTNAKTGGYLVPLASSIRRIKLSIAL